MLFFSYSQTISVSDKLSVVGIDPWYQSRHIILDHHLRTLLMAPLQQATSVCIIRGRFYGLKEITLAVNWFSLRQSIRWSWRVEYVYIISKPFSRSTLYIVAGVSQITPTQFLESINSINELLISAHTLRHSFLDNVVAIFSLQISKLFLTTHFEKVKLLFQLLFLLWYFASYIGDDTPSAFDRWFEYRNI